MLLVERESLVELVKAERHHKHEEHSGPEKYQHKRDACGEEHPRFCHLVLEQPPSYVHEEVRRLGDEICDRKQQEKLSSYENEDAAKHTYSVVEDVIAAFERRELDLVNANEDVVEAVAGR